MTKTSRWAWFFLFAFSWGCTPVLDKAREDYKAALRQQSRTVSEFAIFDRECVEKLTEPGPGVNKTTARAALDRYYVAQDIFKAYRQQVEEVMRDASAKLLADRGDSDDLSAINEAARAKQMTEALQIKFQEAKDGCH